MFGFKRDIKIELNNIWTEIHKLQNFQAKIENAIPTFNKIVEKQKEMDLYIQGSTKLLNKIINFTLPKTQKKGK